MTTKTYKSETMIQALQMVQAELGVSAIVVSMREVPMGPVWNPWQKKGVEIVASAPDVAPLAPRERDGGRASAASAPSPLPSPEGGGGKAVLFVEERPEIEWAIMAEKDPSKLPPPIKLKLTPTPDAAPRQPAPAPAPVIRAESAPKTATKAPAGEKYIPPALKKIQEQLIQQGVESSLIQNLLDLALETLSPTTLADAESCKRSIMQLMETGLRVQKGAGAFLTTNVVCVIGASGSGKTSMTAKLALFFSQNLRKNVTWVCADTVRTGAVAEARSYADALGLSLKLVYTPADLRQIVDKAADGELFLVDTPGYNPCSESQMGELGALLSEMPKRCTYLTAPATTKETDLFQVSAALGLFNVDAVVITKLDETRTFGSIYNFARKGAFPLSFASTGRDAARHLEVADPARLVEALFGKVWM